MKNYLSFVLIISGIISWLLIGRAAWLSKDKYADVGWPTWCIVSGVMSIIFVILGITLLWP